jgi:hypothetical protein
MEEVGAAGEEDCGCGGVSLARSREGRGGGSPERDRTVKARRERV